MEIVQVDIKELRPNPKNPRKITKAELRKLVRSISEFGFVDPIIVNKNKDRYNIIIGGHQRVEAAKVIGMKTVPCTYVDLPEDKEHMLNIALNEISGEWDDEKLYTLLKELQDKDLDLTMTGFDEPYIDEIMKANEELAGRVDEDSTPPAPEHPLSKQGEVWILGDHRLMCGDSTKPEDFAELMGEDKADLCWTDPPYGVSYKGQSNDIGGREWDMLLNDDLKGNDLFEFLVKSFSNAFNFTKEKTALYTCFSAVNHVIFESAINKAGYVMKQDIIWEKGHILGHSDYHWSHEPIMYCAKKGNSNPWYGDRTHKTMILNSTIEQLEELKKEQLIEMISSIRENSDIMSVKKDPSQEYLHSTQKPVALSTRMIKNSSRPREIVLEPFCGSGATLIACETTKRCCRAMELDPKYVDVILTRWAVFTGKDPVRASDGVKWSSVKKEEQ